MPALHRPPAREICTPLRSKKDLPRNTRRSTLAKSVAKRHDERRDQLTPTPAPTVVNAEPLWTPTEPEHIERRPSLVALALLAVAACFAISRGLVGMPLSLPPREAVFGLLSNLHRNAETALVAPLARPADVADEDLPAVRRAGHVSVPGGILVFPESFQPDADGSFDLVIHFHGNTSVVRESADVAKLNAPVAIINLGIGSAPYEEFYAVPGTYEELLETIRAGVERRGVSGASVRRVALSGWSAGYGAISTIMQVRKREDRLDAVLMFDGIHCGWEAGELNARQMKPFVDLAAAAAQDKLYFGITHSAIDPRAYASTTMTADYLLSKVGAERADRSADDTPLYLDLESMKGAVSKKLEKRLLPTSEAHKGSLHVTAFQGETKEDHMAHLFQMGATLLPELVTRWQAQPPNPVN